VSGIHGTASPPQFGDVYKILLDTKRGLTLQNKKGFKDLKLEGKRRPRQHRKIGERGSTAVEKGTRHDMACYRARELTSLLLGEHPARQVLSHSDRQASLCASHVSATALTFKLVDKVGTASKRDAVLEWSHIDGFGIPPSLPIFPIFSYFLEISYFFLFFSTFSYFSYFFAVVSFFCQ